MLHRQQDLVAKIISLCHPLLQRQRPSLGSEVTLTGARGGATGRLFCLRSEPGFRR